MKKLSTLILIFVLLVTTLSFSACQNQVKIDVTMSAEVIPDVTEKIVEGEYSSKTKRYWVLTYYVDPAKCDLSAVNSIKIKTWMPTYRSGKWNTHLTTFTAIIPDDVAPTADKNYFIVELDKSKYNPVAERPYDYTTGQYGDNFVLDEKGAKHFFYYRDFETVVECCVYVNDNGQTEDDPIAGVIQIPSIGLTFVYGIVMALVGFGLYLFALLVCQNKLAVALAFIIPLVTTIGSWFVWGVGRGIIMTVFFVIYYISIETFAKRLAENLGY